MHLISHSVTVIHVEGLDKMDRTPAAIMEELLEQHQVPIFSFTRIPLIFTPMFLVQYFNEIF